MAFCTLSLCFFFFSKKVTFNSQGSPLAIAHILRTHARAQHSRRGSAGLAEGLQRPPSPPRPPAPRPARASPPYLLINRQEHPRQPERWWRGGQSHEPSSLFAELILDYWRGGKKRSFLPPPLSLPSPPPYKKKKERERKRKEIEQGCARCRVGEGRGGCCFLFKKKKKIGERAMERTRGLEKGAAPKKRTLEIAVRSGLYQKCYRLSGPQSPRITSVSRHQHY